MTWAGILCAAAAGVCMFLFWARMKPMADYYKRTGKDWPKEPDDATDDELRIIADCGIYLALFVTCLALACFV